MKFRKAQNLVVIRIYFLAIVLFGSGVMFYLLSLPADPKNVWHFGYSKVRIIMALFTLGVISVGIYLFIKSFLSKAWAEDLPIRLDKTLIQTKNWSFLLVSSGLISIFCWHYYLYLNSSTDPYIRAYLIRFAPIVFWAGAFGIQTIITLLVLRNFTQHKTPLQSERKAIEIGAILIIVIFTTWLIWHSEIFGMKPQIFKVGYSPPPLLLQQLVIACGVSLIYLVVRKIIKLTAMKNRLDSSYVWIGFALGYLFWLMSSYVWLSVPFLEENEWYRSLSFLSNFFLIAITILLFHFPKKYSISLQKSAGIVFTAGTIVFLLVYGSNSLEITRNFSPDSMNYVDVARNISNGKGITQSTLGFNQPHFSIDANVPTPLTSQPPLYSLLIALISNIGLSHADVALLISILSYGVILLLVYLIAIELYDKRVAWLSISFLLVYYPLRYVGNHAWSEPLGIALILLSLLLLTQSERFTTHRKWFLPSIGLASGLAFATRYILIPIFGLTFLFFLVNADHWKSKLSNFGFYTLGFVIPVGAVLGRNYLITGKMLPSPEPSTFDLSSNLSLAFSTIFGKYLDADFQVEQKLASLVLLTIFTVLVLEKNPIASIKSTLIEKQRFLLIFWSLGYIVFLVYQRTRFHFDPIDPRLIAPAGVTIVLLWTALLVRIIKPKINYLIYPILVIITFAALREIKVMVETPVISIEEYLGLSERLTWVANHTTSKDLIIGDDTIDIPFYLKRRAVVSFSPYPYTEHPTYEKIMAYSRKHCDDYKNIYLVIREKYKQEGEWEYFFGQFITDLVYERNSKYPYINLIHYLDDGYVFEVQCKVQE